jgi:TetR/AcrR family tetracycline transcriptional repressor
MSDARALMRALIKKRLGGALNPKQEQIIAAALELLNEGGINNLSLRDIARRTNMQAPALYWHFRNKELLVDFMAEAILQKEFKNLQPRQEPETWQNWLTNHMKQLRKAMLAYSDGGRVVAGAHFYPTVTLGTLFECTTTSLRSTGMDLQTARHITMTATHYTFGFVIEEQAMPTLEQRAEMELEMFRTLYPTIMAAMDESPHTHANADEDFMIGLQYIIRGSA